MDECEKGCSPTDQAGCWELGAGNIIVAIKEAGYRLQPQVDGELELRDDEILDALTEANQNYKPSRTHYLVVNSDIELKAILQAQIRHCEPIIRRQVARDILNLIVTERKTYKLLHEGHKEIKPDDEQSDIYFNGYMRALQVILNMLKNSNPAM